MIDLVLTQPAVATRYILLEFMCYSQCSRLLKRENIGNLLWQNLTNQNGYYLLPKNQYHPQIHSNLWHMFSPLEYCDCVSGSGCFHVCEKSNVFWLSRQLTYWLTDYSTPI
jgi:hypothetical protein